MARTSQGVGNYEGELIEITVNHLDLSSGQVVNNEIFRARGGPQETSLKAKKFILAELTPSVPRAETAESDGVSA